MESGPSAPEAQQAPPVEPRRKPGVLGTILIALAGLVGVLVLLVGVAGLVLHFATRDDDGFYTTDTEILRSDGFAIVTDAIDLGPARGLDAGDAGVTVRIALEGEGGEPVFVGIGRENDVAAYLEGVSHTMLTDWDGSGFDEWGGEPIYEQVAGGRLRSAPGDEDFWVASSEGPGEQVLDWDLAGGTWSVLVANADGSRGVAVEAEAGLRVNWLVWVALGFTVAGLLIAGLCAWGLYRRLRRRPAAQPPES